jgi:hypothetical protein
MDPWYTVYCVLCTGELQTCMQVDETVLSIVYFDSVVT